MSEIQHPLPIGTVIKVNTKSFDNGIMSWGDTDTEIERVAPPGSNCVVWAVDGDLPQYHVQFLPSEVWNILEPSDFAENPDEFEIVELGTGVVPAFYSEYEANPDRERDPTAIEKIAEELAKSAGGPKL